jgi:putative acetyltransferase
VLITTASPHDPDVARLLTEHLEEMHATSPAESVHALPHDALAAPDVTLVAARDGDTLLGIGALKEHGDGLGELKAMRTTASARGRGVGAGILLHLLDVARTAGVSQVAIETGTEEHFAPARRLYARHGFVECGPFADYRPDPLSTFMTLQLD